MQFDKEILKGYIDTIVLSILQNADMYGYEIAKNIKEKSKEEFEIKEVTLYVSLKRLEKKNYLKGYWNDNKSSGGGRRRYYTITEEGRNYFSIKVKEWKFLKTLLNKFMEVILDE
ncbi:PadR family transcriptional regulator [Clostridium scatologenes]|uniref:Transcriptional regulator, PadR-like family n=1 Tax=Clostridium scatologenes TaxID=1548 RepID=A0A0E3M630_CLOSL|nr:PadR family transcriptional regulator [Clostridium scatologenes]AKA69128.1 transcriptional regulator, PadR-like family [Clostridium scatologenes]